MVVRQRNGLWYLHFRPFKGMKEQVGVKLFVKALHEGNSKAERVTAERAARLEAESIALQIFKACRSGYYGDLDPEAREACIRMFANRGWELPPDLGDTEKPSEEPTLKKASEIFLGYPGIKEHPGK